MSLWNNTTYDVRIRAVRAVLEEQLPVTVVAQAYGTNRSTVHRWLARHQQGGDIALERRPVSGRPRKLGSLDTGGLLQIVLAPTIPGGTVVCGGQTWGIGFGAISDCDPLEGS